MKLYIPTLILCSLALDPQAKPGEPYTLTGREKSMSDIYSSDIKAYPDLYEGENIKAYYRNFMETNDLNNGRKLKVGEELMFPHTQKSKEIEDAAIAAAEAKAAAEAAVLAEKEAEARRIEEEKADALSAEEQAIADAAARRERARHWAVVKFQHEFIPYWLNENRGSLPEKIEALKQIAQSRIDTPFSEALVLHSFPEKRIDVLEFEMPTRAEGCFFCALKVSETGKQRLYALEQGISMFGAGDVSKFYVAQPNAAWSNYGGRDYKDLTSFVAEIEKGPTIPE